MRKDERGIVIPAPLQGNDSALAGRRYGDKHRGPAVFNAYELWHCRIDLADRSERWPCPPNLPARMVELAQAIRDDQRADWLRRQANLEEVDRRISYAIRSGDLPIWVAPQGEPERLVATSALATIDKRSIIGGVFCPLSEEYKSEADRPWLWERPLFVKWDEWVRFAAAIDEEKVRTKPQQHGEGESEMHDQWCLCFQAVRQLHQVLKKAVGDADPASWVTTAEWHEKLETLKWNARTGLTFRRAMLAGDLKAYFLNDGIQQLVPGWAWENGGASAEAMHLIELPLDPFLDYSVDSDMRTYIKRTELDSWLNGDNILSADGLPTLPIPYDIGTKPAAILYSEPSDTPFVDLTEAVTWAAFNIAMSRGVFLTGEHYRFGPFASDNYAATIHDAVVKLIAHASGGSIRVRGRYVERYFDDRAAERADTTDISDNALRDFGRFDAVHSGLQAGRGYFHGSALDEVFNGSRNDGWRDVEVCRAELLTAFRAREGKAKPTVATTSTAGAEKECREWLSVEFAADPRKRRTKAEFQSAALANFSGRLSVRGFVRAWDAIAPQAGRSTPGRKS